MSAEHIIEAIGLERRTDEEGNLVGRVEQLRRVEGKLEGFPVAGIPHDGEYISQRDKAIEMANRLGTSYLEINKDLVREISVYRWVEGATKRMLDNVIIIPRKKR